jgi:hypothetical protein
MDAHAYDGQLALKIEALRHIDTSMFLSLDEAYAYFESHSAYPRRDDVVHTLHLLRTGGESNVMQGVDAASLLRYLHAQCRSEPAGVELVLEQLADIRNGSCPSGRVHRLLQLIWC